MATPGAGSIYPTLYTPPGFVSAPVPEAPPVDESNARLRLIGKRLLGTAAIIAGVALGVLAGFGCVVALATFEPLLVIGLGTAALISVLRLIAAIAPCDSTVERGCNALSVVCLAPFILPFAPALGLGYVGINLLASP